MFENIETARLVLQADVQVRRVGELPPELRKFLRVSDPYVLVTRPGSRTLGKLLDPQGADFLKEFRSPCTIADAILRSSSRLKVPVRSVSGPATMLVQNLLAAKILVRSEEAAEEPIAARLAPGTAVGSFEVVSLLHWMEDTEIYTAKGVDGSDVVIKIARSSRAWIRRKLQHEAAVLQALGGAPAPGLLETTLDAKQPYLILERCRGINAAVAADKLRRSGYTARSYEIGELCCQILEAYCLLHRRAVLHGDVHPANVLVDLENKSIRILDFDLAQTMNIEKTADLWMRGGDPRFFEPEYAQALLVQQTPPPVTPRGEQYSLAALLYRLITGRHYLLPELVEQALLQTIVSVNPLPFPASTPPELRSLEAILRRALEKEPGSRFASLREMADAMRQTLEKSRAEEQGRYFNRPSQDPELFPAILSHYSEADSITNDLPPPAASINFGAAGIAYLFYRCSLLLNRPELLAVADQWLDKAKAIYARGSNIYAPALNITPATVGDGSLYHSSTGAACVESLLWSTWGSSSAALDAARVFAQTGITEDRLDLISGSAGLLLGCTMMYEALSPYQTGRSLLVTCAHRFRDHLWSTERPWDQSLIPETPPFLGIAHGWGGALYATLRWTAASGQPLPARASARLEEVAGLARRVQGRASWPRTVGGDESWPGWCHGSAGHAQLWTLAHAVLRNAEYLQLAREAAEDVWQRQHPAGHLCCGSSGQAYAMLALYQCTGEGYWVDRARTLLQHALSQVGSRRLRPGSLYAGEIGVALLEADLLQPDTAAMPFFGPEGGLPLHAPSENE